MVLMILSYIQHVISQGYCHKYGSHPFDWTNGGVKGSSKIIGNFGEVPLAFLVHSECGGDERNTYFWEDKWLGDNTYMPYFLIYIRCLLSEIISWCQSFLCQILYLFHLLWVSIFHWPIGKWQISWLFYLCFVSFDLRPVGGHLRLVRSPSKGFSCCLFFGCLTPSYTFSLVWRVKISK